MAQIQFDFKGIVTLLARHLYSEKKVFIRELVQNAHDAIKRREHAEPGFAGRIDIFCRPDEDRVIFRDTGIGMSRADLEEYLSSIGASGTREAGVEGLIGQFGIGFLSAFIVARRVEVRTRKLGDRQGWLWVNEGDQSYTLEPCDVADVGCSVDVTIADIGDRGLVRDEFVKDMIRQYCDLLRVPIHVGASESPINTMNMPWEREGRTDAETRLDCHVYLEKTMRDSVLETIPLRVDEQGLKARGVLYISRARLVAVEAPRTVRVFQKRMFLCENAVDLLPKWLTFVNGVVDTPSLVPTAARDNFQRDETFGRLREALGRVVIAHLDRLRATDPTRLAQILNYHELNIKAACDYYDDFFDRFAHLLEWRVNSGQATGGELSFRTLPLADILALLPQAAGAPRRLSAFATGSSANQYFDMANANGTVVVDASRLWDARILEKLARRPGSGFELLFIDREEDPNVFRALEDGDEPVRRLAEAMGQLIRPGGARLRVEARHFQPGGMVAVIRASAVSVGQERAREMLEDPNIPSSMREMAEEMVRMARSESMRLTINASNPFVQRLARQDPRIEPVRDLMMGIYNNAILYNQELLTPHNARIFHDQFASLLERSVDYLEERAVLQAQRAEIERERRARDAAANPPERPAHPVFFLITPFAKEFRPLEDALRRVVEDGWGCQLRLARDTTFKDDIRENVQVHLEQADAFLAEITTGNANVMYELGAARATARDRPVILLCRQPPGEAKATLPADLQGLLYLQYDAAAAPDDLVKVLEGGLANDERLKQRLGAMKRERFVSARRLLEITSVRLEPRQAEALARKYPTLQRWTAATPEAIAQVAGLRPGAAALLLEEVRSSATEA